MKSKYVIMYIKHISKGQDEGRSIMKAQIQIV